MSSKLEFIVGPKIRPQLWSEYLFDIQPKTNLTGVEINYYCQLG